MAARLPAEVTAAMGLQAQGYDVSRHGWPDLWTVAPNGMPVAIEVKGKGDALSLAQRLCHEWLRAQGVEVRVVDERGNPWKGER